MNACNSENVQFDPIPSAEDSVPLSAKLYRPSDVSEPLPAIVLLHGCAGILPKHKDWANELTAWGYIALIVDSFGPRNLDRICEDNDEQWARFDRLRPQDAKAAFDYLISLPEVDPERIAVMGWSNGGTVALGLAESSLQPEGLDFRAAVAMYPSCWQFSLNHPKRHYNFSSPVMLAYGALDNWTMPAHCEPLIDSLSIQSEPVDLELYAGAFHDFDNSRQPVMRLQGVRVETDNGWGNVTIGYDQAAHDQFKIDLKAFLENNFTQ